MFVIETIIENSLYSIKYDDSEQDEFENDKSKQNEFSRCFKNWTDTEYLEVFFNANKQDLQKAFYKFISIEKAIEQTIDEALTFEEKLIDIAKKEKTNDSKTLQNLFKPLNKKDELRYPIPALQQSKAYGSVYSSWLRIYAIRIDPNVFIITGGAIKLTDKMDERPHTQNELTKLNKVRQFLIDEEIIDNDSIIDYLEL